MGVIVGMFIGFKHSAAAGFFTFVIFGAALLALAGYVLARSQDRKAARVMSAWAVMWAASALSCAGVNLRGRWPRRVLALTSPVRRRRISAL
jgi:hypothetical protein